MSAPLAPGSSSELIVQPLAALVTSMAGFHWVKGWRVGQNPGQPRGLVGHALHPRAKSLQRVGAGRAGGVEHRSEGQ